MPTNAFSLRKAYGPLGALVLAASALFLGAPARAATRVWSGAADGFWANPANWGGTVPGAGDDLSFPASPTRLIVTNNLASGLLLNSISFGGSAYVASGNPLVLNAGLTNNSPSFTTNRFSCLLTLTNSPVIRCSSGSLLLGSDINLAGKTLTLDSSDDLNLSGVISNTGAVLKIGPGRLSLQATNTYDGPTTVLDGTLALQNSFALGSTSGITTITGGVPIEVWGPLVVPETLLITNLSQNGQIENHAGSNVFTGPIEFDVQLLAISGTDQLVLAGHLSGTGGISVSANALVLSGTQPNTYGGRLVLNSGTVKLNKTPGATAIPTYSFVTGTLQWLASDQVADNVGLKLQPGGLLDLNGQSDTIGSLSGSGNLSLGSGTLAVGADNITTNYSGQVSGSGGLTKVGTGTWTLLGNNIHTGPTTVSNGTLVISGVQTASPVVVNGGILNATATLGTLTVNAGGLVTPGPTPAVLNCTNLTLTPGGVCLFKLNGPNPGTDYDQLSVNGTVNLGNGTLQVGLGFTPPLNTSFIIITNDGADAVTGTFAGLPNGSSFVTNNLRFVVSYTGGSGNDVTLTVGAIPTGTTRTWSGAGANGLWSNPANWVGGVAPLPGDDLLFPPAAGHLANTNDFPSGTSFNLIAFTGPNYVVDGNTIYLNGGLSNAPPAGTTNTFNPNAQLGASVTISCGTNSSLILGSTITLLANALSFNSSGKIYVNPGLINGTGTLTMDGAGTVYFMANTYTASTTVNAGRLVLLSPAALGFGAAGVTVAAAGTLEVQAGGPITKGVILSGTLDNTSGDNSFTGSGSFPSVLATVRVATNTSLTLSGSIAGGTGGVVKTGPGILVLAGNGVNTFGGGTLVKEGTLRLSKTAGRTAIPAGGLVIGDNSGLAAAVQMLAANQIADSASVTVNSGAVFDLGGTSDEVGALTLVEGVITNGSLSSSVATVTVGTLVGNPSFIYSGLDLGTLARTFTLTNTVVCNVAGPISGTAGLTELGAGTLVLSGTNTYSGATTVNGGTLLVNGLQPQSLVTVLAGTLGGTGTVGTINNTAGGAVSPGASPGILTSSNLTFAGSSSVLAIQINGAAPGSGYDQLNVRGTNGLGGCTLSASLGNSFTPATGNTFVILNNDGSDPIAGTFNGLPEGTLLPISGATFRITYVGGDGNDVVLIRTNAPASTIGSIAQLNNGQFQLQGAGISNLFYTVLASTNLSNWISIGQAAANTSGVFSFTDTNAPSFPTRFYRVLSP